MENQLHKIDIDQKMQDVLAKVLRMAIVLATSIIIVGGIVFLYGNAHSKVVFDVFKPQNTSYVSIPAILNGLKAGNGLAIVQLGILLLIVTPMIRVLFAVLSFLKEKDYLYVALGTLAFLIIFLSSYFEVLH